MDADDTVSREEAQRNGRRAMSSVDEIFYGTRTVQENAGALEAVVQQELDLYSERVFRGILALARES